MQVFCEVDDIDFVLVLRYSMACVCMNIKFQNRSAKSTVIGIGEYYPHDYEYSKLTTGARKIEEMRRFCHVLQEGARLRQRTIL
jgi:hypothetical protein